MLSIFIYIYIESIIDLSLLKTKDSKENTHPAPIVTETSTGPSRPQLLTSDSLPFLHFQDSLARNTDMFIELNKIPNMKQFLEENIAIAELFIKHPDIGMVFFMTFRIII